MKFIYVLVTIAFIAAIDAASPKSQNLCDKIRCNEDENVKVCGMSGGHYKVFENGCELRKYNCNKGQRFTILDDDACRIVFELGMGGLFQNV